MRTTNQAFETLWNTHPVAQSRSRTYTLLHPEAGPLTLHATLTALPDAPACCALDLYAAEPRSPSAETLRHLAAIADSR